MSAGNSERHDAGYEHVTGRAVYVDDQRRSPDELHLAIGTSTVASGRVLSLDVSAVREAPEVVDVLTADDFGEVIDIGPVFPGDPLLAAGQVTHFGQALFAVAATSHRAARRAVQRATIEYEEATPLLDISEALQQRDFVRPPHQMRRGDVESALVNAPHRLQGEMRIGGQEHFYLEGQIARAEPLEHGGVMVFTSNQNPTETQHLLAEVLQVPMHRVQVEVRRMGGGFGGKETQATAPAVLAALFSHRHGRPASCRYSRRDDMLLTGKRHPFLAQFDVGFDDDGVIHGIRHLLAGQCGHSPDLSDAIVDRAMFHADNAYYLPHVEITGYRCRSNTVSNTAFRGFGGPQGMLAMETVIDAIAADLDIDPFIVRRRNLYGSTDRNITPYHQRVTTFTVPTLMDTLAERADYAERRRDIAQANADNAVVKRGIALTPVKFGISFTVTHLNQAGALLHIYSDGSALLNHGGTEMGQGLFQKVRQVVATELGMASSRIAVSATRTDKVPNTSATAASSGSDLNGMAALQAAQELTRRLRDWLCDEQRADAGSVEFRDDVVSYTVDGALRTRSWEDIAKAAYLARIPLSATGFYATPDIGYDRASASGRPFYYYACGAAVTEVAIDTYTGETRVLRTDILHDVGRSINPALDLGQIEGGYVQGLGWLTHEELVWDTSGRLLTDGPATYKIPAISDMPIDFRTSLLADSPNDEATVFHSKAVGEPPLMLAISAFAAIRDALGSLSDDSSFVPLDAPATPERVLAACDAIRERQ